MNHLNIIWLKFRFYFWLLFFLGSLALILVFRVSNRYLRGQDIIHARTQTNGGAAVRHKWQHQVWNILILVFILLYLGSSSGRVICCCCFARVLTSLWPCKALLLQYFVGWQLCHVSPIPIVLLELYIWNWWFRIDPTN